MKQKSKTILKKMNVVKKVGLKLKKEKNTIDIKQSRLKKNFFQKGENTIGQQSKVGGLKKFLFYIVLNHHFLFD